MDLVIVDELWGLKSFISMLFFLSSWDFIMIGLPLLVAPRLAAERLCTSMTGLCELGGGGGGATDRAVCCDVDGGGVAVVTDIAGGGLDLFSTTGLGRFSSSLKTSVSYSFTLSTVKRRPARRAGNVGERDDELVIGDETLLLAT